MARVTQHRGRQSTNTKHVESLLIACLDAGSNPASSTSFFVVLHTLTYHGESATADMNRILFFFIFFLAVLASNSLTLQAQNTGADKWALSTRLLLSGSSDHSEPQGYIVYSGISIEASVRRKLIRSFSLELSVRTESREIDREIEGISDPVPLGSVELIPLNLTLQYRLPLTGSFVPFAGVGMNMTFCWEKSGALNSTDLSPGLGLLMQIGTELKLNENLLVQLLAEWNSYSTEINSDDVAIARLDINPVGLGLGISYCF